MVIDNQFVINLEIRPDRLSLFLDRLPSCFTNMWIWPAVHGDTIPHPDWWNAGAGAWGCYRSHMQILEYAYQHNLESYIVFEDDALFCENFTEQFEQFLHVLPKDWQQFYIGGQLLWAERFPPKKIADGVYQPHNVNRTQAFAVHRRGYNELYRHLNKQFAFEEHIDHHLGRLHETGQFHVYCPGKWLVGQDGGSSNISSDRDTNAATFYVDPEIYTREGFDWKNREIPCIFLQAPMQVVLELERQGWHRGKWQNEQRLDRGVCAALQSLDLKQGLHNWFKAVYPEAQREGKACVCLQHPNLHPDSIKLLDFAHFETIVANTVAEATEALAAVEVNTSYSPSRENVTNHLIYYIWPKNGNGIWQWNVQQLLRRIELFDGKRIVAVSLSEDSATLNEVQTAFADAGITTWLVCDNNPRLGEAVGFNKLLQELPVERGNTFYAHAKGVSYSTHDKTREWTEIMYEVCLDDPTFVMTSLALNPATGPFYRDKFWEGGAKNQWYYSGSFYWFRNEDLLTLPDAYTTRADRWAAELWLGDLLDKKDAGSLFARNCGHLYDSVELDKVKTLLTEYRRQRRATNKFGA